MRYRINGLMLVISVVAANLWLGRTLWATRSLDSVLAGAVMGIALQVATFKAARNRRGFWLGFAAAGGLVMASALVAALHQESVVAGVWDVYFEKIAVPMLNRFEVVIQRGGNPIVVELVDITLESIAWLVPEVAFAVVGGLIGGRVGRRWGGKPAVSAGPVAA